MKGKRVLVTGAAGFIGFHTTIKLLEEGAIVHGIDDLNNYYDVELKKARIDFIDKKKEIKGNNWFFSIIKLDVNFGFILFKEYSSFTMSF